jgi:hypothetical protein
VGSVFARSHAAADSRRSTWWSSNQRAIHPDELVDEVIDALLVGALGGASSLASVEILREDLL